MADRIANPHVLTNAQYLSIQSVAASVRKKEHFYEALLRCGFHLPALKSTLCSLDYLEKVKRGLLWCPLKA